MIERELATFVRCVEHYFAAAFSHPPQIGTPYLVETRAKIAKDYTGIIGISGRRSGTVWFTAPRGLLRVLLMTHGETEITDDNLADLVGEVANTISGNVRRDFGKDFLISVPSVVTGEPDPAGRPATARSIVIPIHIRNHEARLVVALR